MPLLKRIRSLEKKYALSFFGFVLGVAFGGLGIYTSFFQERKSNLRYEILSNAAVLDVHENVGKLDIFFAGINIKESRQTLRIIIIRVVNDGQLDILKASYDENEPLGFSLVSGELAESPELLQASNDYLSRNLRVQATSQQRTLFPNVIIERGEFFTIKVLVLHKEGVIPDVVPTGKIAGIKTIPVVHTYKEKTDDSFLRRTYSGDIGTQIVRAVSYPIALVLCMVVIVLCILPIAIFGDWLSRKRREKLVRRFKVSSGEEYSKNAEFIFERFESGGESTLLELEYLFARRESLERFLVSLGDEPEDKLKAYISAFRRRRGIDPEFHDSPEYISYSGLYLIQRLLRNGVIQKSGDKVTFNTETMKTLEDFLRFLRVISKVEKPYLHLIYIDKILDEEEVLHD